MSSNLTVSAIVRSAAARWAHFVARTPVRSLRSTARCDAMGRAVLSRFAETHPQVYTREDLDEQEAKRRAMVFGLVFALISVMLTIGAIASVVIAL